ncbi:MAG: DUF11 domain-containing protein [Betaproteobacteria bacterium]|nr:DUF11 domain-containing protein [Betaproteobacteria bacterium]
MNSSRFVRLFLASLLLGFHAAPALSQQCATPGRDGSPTIAGVVNTYYVGAGVAPAGGNSVTVAGTAGRGAVATLAAGDLILVMQMQDGTDMIVAQGSSYGSIEPAKSPAGRYEFAVVTGVAGNTIGVATPLRNTYHQDPAVNKTFQVVRVPQYQAASIAGTVTSAPWDGLSGGLVVLDVVGQLTVGGSIDVSRQGFRGGGWRAAAGAGPGFSEFTYFEPMPLGAHGMKGEGFAGTPDVVREYGVVPATVTLVATGRTYAGGSLGRGAATQAGGGGNDGFPATNEENSGGGGGGNGGVGGHGGYNWSRFGTPIVVGGGVGGIGGRGRADFLGGSSSAAGFAFLGGGGGAGTSNNLPGNPNSSGAGGGGIVVVRAGSIAGAGSIIADGAAAPDIVTTGGQCAAGDFAQCDASGGGGAGGSVVLISRDAASVGGVVARGGNGGSLVGVEHGPGGGGGGGFSFRTPNISTAVNLAGGPNGTVAGGLLAPNYGATGGGSGVAASGAAPDLGALAGSECRPAIDVVKAAGTVSGAAATAPAAAFEVPYTIRMRNTGAVALGNVQVVDNLAATFVTGSPATAIRAGSFVVTPAGGATAGQCAGPAAAYDGRVNLTLLRGDQTLQPGQGCDVAFGVVVTYPAAASVPTDAQNNSAYASSAPTPNAGGSFTGATWTPPAGATVTDRSTNSATPPTAPNADTPTPTPVMVGNSGITGKAWRDTNHNRSFDAGEAPLAGWRVQVFRGTGTTPVAETTTDAAGNYQFAALPPSTPGNTATNYAVRFLSPTGEIFGTPVSADPVPARNGTIGQFGIEGLALVPGAATINQDLPLDPQGVVYDSATRQPVAGASVTVTGPAGFDPATHLFGGAGSQTVTTAATGEYQFLLMPTAPAGTYTLTVSAPNFTAPSALIPPQATALDPTGGPSPYLVQAQAAPPSGAQPTIYYLALSLAPGDPNIVNNHIPVDPLVAAQALFIQKQVDRGIAELGDSVMYTITVRNPNATVYTGVSVVDRMPAGFRLIPGTVRLASGGPPLSRPDPAGAPGPVTTYDIGTLAANATATLTYRVRIGVGALEGDGVNRAQARSGTAVSNVATARVRVQGGVFAREGCVVGKIFVDCNHNRVQDGPNEVGIPGVRLYFEDGTFLISDEEGKYSICGLRPITHVLGVDRTTLPVGARLVDSSTRHAGDPNSRFVDLKVGELHRADFVEGSCSESVLDQVKARRARGPVRGPETEKSGIGFTVAPGERGALRPPRQEPPDKPIFFDSSRKGVADPRHAPCATDAVCMKGGQK